MASSRLLLLALLTPRASALIAPRARARGSRPLSALPDLPDIGIDEAFDGACASGADANALRKQLIRFSTRADGKRDHSSARAKLGRR